jgi:hypothetical protein
MSRREIGRTLTGANPISREAVERLAIGGEDDGALAELLASATEDPAALESSGLERTGRRWLRPRYLAAIVAPAAAVAIVLVAVGGSGSSPEEPASAYGAELVRFAESTPLLLLEEPGWRVRSIDQQNGQGRMEFGIASPATPEAPIYKTHTRHGIALHRDGLRRAELTWSNRSEMLKLLLHPRVDRVPGRKIKTTIPALGTKVHIDTRAETSSIYGGPGHHQMEAVWKEDGRVLVLNATVPDLAAFRERLGWLRRVDARAWLDAMPAKVVKAADYGAAVRAMLQGIPLPPGFDPTRISDPHLTNDRYQVGAAVGGAVACAWFGSWDEAIRRGDTSAAKEAERVLQGAGSWPIFREMSKEGAYPATVVEYGKAMPSRRWYGRPLLPEVEQGLGCAPSALASQMRPLASVEG